MKNTVNVEHAVIEMFDIIQTIIYEAELICEKGLLVGTISCNTYDRAQALIESVKFQDLQRRLYIADAAEAYCKQLCTHGKHVPNCPIADVE